MKKPMELMVALDFSSVKTAEEWMEKFGDLPVIYKVGYQLFLTAGPDWVARQTARGKRIFLDLKLYDIPNTVERGVERACDLGVEYLTLHLSSGSDALEKSQKHVQKVNSPLCLLGVTVLTSFSEDKWQELGRAWGSDLISIQSSIKGLLNLARESGIPGIVCSGWDLRDARK
ncbi:MAG: orotidine-5'-phosphate decarboxylase, partial [Proteobacteria bacterium]